MWTCSFCHEEDPPERLQVSWPWRCQIEKLFSCIRPLQEGPFLLKDQDPAWLVHFSLYKKYVFLFVLRICMVSEFHFHCLLPLRIFRIFRSPFSKSPSLYHVTEARKSFEVMSFLLNLFPFSKQCLSRSASESLSHYLQFNEELPCSTTKGSVSFLSIFSICSLRHYAKELSHYSFPLCFSIWNAARVDLWEHLLPRARWCTRRVCYDSLFSCVYAWFQIDLILILNERDALRWWQIVNCVRQEIRTITSLSHSHQLSQVVVYIWSKGLTPISKVSCPVDRTLKSIR